MVNYDCDFKFDKFDYMVYRSILPRKHEQINHRRNWAMYYISEGSVEIEINDETYVLYENSYIFFDRNESYLMKNPSDHHATLYIITYVLPELDMTNAEFGIERYSNLEKDNAVASLVTRLFNTWTEKKTGYIIKSKSLFLNLIYNIIVSSNDTNLLLNEYSNLQRAIRYIHSNYSGDIRLDDLCSASNYSPTHIRRLFLKYFGLSPVKYITKYRIERAIFLLNYDNNYSVTQIAHMVGFNDICYFSKIFKKTTGFTPLEYKSSSFS